MILIKGWQRLVQWAFALWCIHLGLIGSKSVFRASCCQQTKRETYFSSCNCHSSSPAGGRTSVKADTSRGEKEEGIVSRRAMLKNWGDELFIQNPSAGCRQPPEPNYDARQCRLIGKRRTYLALFRWGQKEKCHRQSWFIFDIVTQTELHIRNDGENNKHNLPCDLKSYA